MAQPIRYISRSATAMLGEEHLSNLAVKFAYLEGNMFDVTNVLPDAVMCKVD